MSWRAGICVLFGIVGAGWFFLSQSAFAQEETAPEPLSDIELYKAPVKVIQAPEGKAVNNTTLRLGEGMEVVEMGGTNVLVPKGARVSKEHGMIVYEDTGAFLARRFNELESRIAELEMQQQALKVMIEELHAKDTGKSLISQ